MGSDEYHTLEVGQALVINRDDGQLTETLV